MRFPGNRSCTLTKMPRLTGGGESNKRGDLRFGMAAPACNSKGSILKATLRRWAVVARALLASTWLFIAPWLAALVART